MNTIHLVIIDGIIVAHHHGPHAEDIQSLFGTTMLPTPFSASYGLENAKAKLQILNPTAIVTTQAGR